MLHITLRVDTVSLLPTCYNTVVEYHNRTDLRTRGNSCFALFDFYNDMYTIIRT